VFEGAGENVNVSLIWVHCLETTARRPRFLSKFCGTVSEMRGYFASLRMTARTRTRTRTGAKQQQEQEQEQEQELGQQQEQEQQEQQQRL
jgi:hypothetical protein